jgi:hypothetical protein
MEEPRSYERAAERSSAPAVLMLGRSGILAIVRRPP